jgi:hypothetical protein
MCLENHEKIYGRNMVSILMRINKDFLTAQYRPDKGNC